MKTATKKKINVIRAEDMTPKLKAVPTPVRLNLGSGDRPLEGHVNVDIVKTPTVDKVCDLMKFPWPWKDASVDAIVSHHFFEHFEPEQRIKFMEECWRILKDTGTIELVVPYWASMRSIQDPTHKWPPIAETSFLYFCKRWLVENKLTHAHPYKCNYEFVYGYGINPIFVQKAEEPRAFACAHYNNSVDDLFVKLTKVSSLNS